MNAVPRLIAVLCSLAFAVTGCYMGVTPGKVKAGVDSEAVRSLLKDKVKDYPDSELLNGGTAVYYPKHDAAFWTKDGKVYVVNERAKALAPGQEQAPETITYQAIFDATLSSDGLGSVRAIDAGMHGGEISPEEAKELEAALAEHPDDLWGRAVLMGYYHRKHGDAEARAALEKHALWLIRNKPESIYAGSHEVQFMPQFFGKGPYTEAAAIWKEHVAKNPENPRILGNAAAFFMVSDQELTRKYLEKCAALEPANREWQSRLAASYSLSSMTANMLGTKTPGQPEDAKKALEAKEKELSLTTGVAIRGRLMNDLASIAFEAGDIEKARKYATDVFAGLKLERSWNDDDLVHGANTVLGRVALKENDPVKAKEYLLASLEVKDLTRLSPFGPSMTLAREMLEHGERDAVIEYMERCGKSWKKEIMKAWVDTIKAGGTPNFSFWQLMPELPAAKGTQNATHEPAK